MHTVQEIRKYYLRYFKVPDVIENFYVGHDWYLEQIIQLGELVPRLKVIFKIWGLGIVRHMNDESNPYLREAIDEFIALNELNKEEIEIVDQLRFDPQIYDTTHIIEETETNLNVSDEEPVQVNAAEESI
jgi:hypothetical protein